MSAPRDQRQDRLACLVVAAVLFAAAGSLAWLGAPRETAVVLAILAAAYGFAGLFKRLWWLRNMLLFQFRAM